MLIFFQNELQIAVSNCIMLTNSKKLIYIYKGKLVPQIEPASLTRNQPFLPSLEV